MFELSARRLRMPVDSLIDRAMGAEWRVSMPHRVFDRSVPVELDAARDFIVNDVYAYESDENDRQGDVEQIINAALAASPTAEAERPTDDEIEAAACPEPSEAEVEAAAKASFAVLGKTDLNLDEMPELKAKWTASSRAALLAARAVEEDQ